MYDHDDPVAWQAIANVERERKKKEYEARHPKPQPKQKGKDPRPPVDWRKVMASPNKKIRVNRAWLFYSGLEKAIDELRKPEVEK